MKNVRAFKSCELRQAQTRVERRAWYLLRNGHVAGLKFRRQQPIDHYTVDFYCPELRVALELDGGVHSQPSQAKRDKAKDEYLRALGIRVVRIPNALVMEDPEKFVRKIAGLTRLDPSPVPTPSGHPLPQGAQGERATIRQTEGNRLNDLFLRVSQDPTTETAGPSQRGRARQRLLK
jgi:very-short-patch-repair endonuclease